MRNRLRRFFIVAAALFALFNVVYFSALRGWHLRWGATGAELSAVAPGDKLLADARPGATHAVTIHAAPEKIWPWLMQIGQDRGGFYSYTPLENLIGCEMPKVERIVPQWPARKVGETVWFATPKHYDGQAKMIAAVVDPGRAFVMVSAPDWRRIQAGQPGREGSWGFTLEPAANGQTRLIARGRGASTQTFRSHLTNLFFWEPAHFIMERRMLLTIKRLAESTS
jgi:hypothetical protein